MPGRFQVFEDFCGCWGVVVVFDGLGEIFEIFAEIFSQHIAEGCENILLIERGTVRAYEKAEMVHSQDYPVEIDSHPFLWVKAYLWCRCG